MNMHELWPTMKCMQIVWRSTTSTSTNSYKKRLEFDEKNKFLHLVYQMSLIVTNLKFDCINSGGKRVKTWNFKAKL